MKLDKTKPYGQIIGAVNGARFEQNGKEYDFEGNPIIEDEAEPVKRKPGRPPKEDKTA